MRDHLENYLIIYFFFFNMRFQMKAERWVSCL